MRSNLEDFLVYPLDLVGHYDSAIEDAGLVDTALFGHCPYSRRQLLANAVMATSRVGS